MESIVRKSYTLRKSGIGLNKCVYEHESDVTRENDSSVVFFLIYDLHSVVFDNCKLNV